MLVTVIRQEKIGEALPSKIYINGGFYAYGLENDAYKIPTGSFSGFVEKSPSFGKDKLYLNVSGRDGIMFHGGNYHTESKGCILCAKNRSNDLTTISADCSNELASLAKSAIDRGESVTIAVTNEKTKTVIFALLAAGAGMLLYTLLKR